MAYTVFIRNHFFENNSSKSEPIGPKFLQGDVGSRGTLPCKLSAPAAKHVQNGAKTDFANFFVAKTTHCFTHFLQMISLNLNTKHESMSS